MSAYPIVLSEFETLSLVTDGQSIARYGDGEFHLCSGLSVKCQRYDPVLQTRLVEILQRSGECLVGIPNLHSDTPKVGFWKPFMAASRFLVERPYVSAFISRPDCAPWIDRPDYWEAVESLWIDQDVTLVRGSERSLTAKDLIGAGKVTEVIGPKLSAWSDYEKLMAQIGTPKRVLLCLGPAATVMAVDLCSMGVHAVDLGHVGMWLKKYRRGEPMIRTEADKVSG